MQFIYAPHVKYNMGELLNKYKELLFSNKTSLANIKHITENKNRELLNRIMKIIEIIDGEIEKITKILQNLTQLNDYNDQFRKYMYNYFNHLFDLFNQFQLNLAHLNIDTQMQLIEEYTDNLLNNFNNYSKMYTIFENFKYGKKNYVIFGKNGSGKTSLLKYIADNLLPNSLIIPADRVLNYSRVSNSYDECFNLYGIMHSNNPFCPLIREMRNRDLSLLKNGHKKEDTIENKFTIIFDSLGLERKALFNYEFIYLYDDDIKQYSLEKASDGEKSIISIILAVLLAPENSFIFIDEPENHLNGALLNTLFDNLENERRDLRFIYLTHNIDFVERRKNVELIYLEKTKKYQEWLFKSIDDYNDIPLNIILTIEGTKKDILFCEGNKDSVDFKIYSCLFDDKYNVIPVESCVLVKNNTKTINSKNSLYMRNAIGIVDDDFMLDEEKSVLQNDNIYSIEFNEIESFLIQSIILEYVNKKLLNKDLDLIKNKVVDLVKGNNKINIINDFIRKQYPKIIQFDKLCYNNDFNQQIKSISDSNNQKFCEIIENFKTRINDINDYDQLTKMIPGKMFIGIVSTELGFKNNDAYIDFVVKQLVIDKEFKTSVYNSLKFTTKLNTIS